ncbi:dethiobiotin synthase [Pedobacter sp. SYSU D00535]|uniref:dethiobiotin synthase n=1 Tax=Pedobacter sp. SYSU D00535 TaxID=2810308 RepID=UPI001A968517|nr:dethiobiotin synthase [Pedobacter sp. SYSU D00535]
MKAVFITGIGTEVGKTVTSAVLVEKFKIDYWKPIQSGDLDNSDTDKVKRLVSNNESKFHSEAYRLSQPFSPHKSAALDGIEISLSQITIPPTKNDLLIEGAGGLMVPLNDQHYIIDLIQRLETEVILVIRHYLGSINHTLLSIDALKSRDISLRGIIFNGASDEYSEKAILNYSGARVLGRIPDMEVLTPETITAAGRGISAIF